MITIIYQTKIAKIWIEAKNLKQTLFAKNSAGITGTIFDGSLMANIPSLEQKQFQLICK
jgi:hypothetical protein